MVASTVKNGNDRLRKGNTRCRPQVPWEKHSCIIRGVRNQNAQNQSKSLISNIADHRPCLRSPDNLSC